MSAPLPSASPADVPRVLLLEFVALGRFTLDQRFPFLHARLKQAGHPVRWLRFGLPAAVQFARGEDGIGLDEPDLAALEGALADARPSHVLCSHAPAAGVRRVLEAPGRRWHESIPGDAELFGWLGLPEAERAAPLEDGLPDFGFLAGNAAARLMTPVAFIRSGTECFYRRSVEDNPAYDGVDLDGCRTTGCAFCTTGGGQVQATHEDLVARTLAQLTAFVRTHPFPTAARPQARLSGYRALAEARAIVAGIRRAGLRPLDLLFDARVDQLVSLEPSLHQAAQALAGTGHRLHVCLVGIESFSRAELLRMNKGVLPWQNLAAIRVLRTLERDHPETFRFREHGGLSTILYTPWTTLDDLATGLGLARRFDLHDVLGKFLHSRLRLYEGLPMTALARRDGLLAEGYEDPALDTARRNFYAREVPWRFAHPEVEALNRITVRMHSDDAFAGDPLYGRVQAWLGTRLPLDAAIDLVKRARALPEVTVDALLAPDPAPAAPPPAERRLYPLAPLEGVWRAAKLLLRLQQAGLNRVNRLETVPAHGAAEVEAWLRAQGRAVAPMAFEGEGGPLDLFFGAQEAEAKEAAELTLMLRKGCPAPEVVRARRRIGELFGYPACCAEGFAHVSTSVPTVNEWLTVLRRSAVPGELSPLLSPLNPALPYIPCSYRCERTLARAERAFAVLTAEGGDGGGFVPRGAPIVFLLDRPGQLAELEGVAEADGVLQFSGARCFGADERLRAFEGGGTLRVEDGTLLLDRGGARVLSLFLEAAVFWAARPLDPKFWREVALQVLEPIVPPRVHAPLPAAEPLQSTGASPLVARVEAALGGRAPIRGHDLRSVAPAAGRVLVTLSRQGAETELLELYVEPAAAARHWYVKSGEWAITFSSRTPLRTAAQRQAVAELAARLGQAPRAGGP